jgi:hypothetical protein
MTGSEQILRRKVIIILFFGTRCRAFYAGKGLTVKNRKMRTIIVSDIKSKAKSIIPYGLELAKHLESQADIVHVIDPRTLHGIPGAYADSQTVSPGGKQQYDIVVDKEIRNTADSIDHLLGRETSRLNYPARVNKIIEQESIEVKLKKLTREGQSPVVVACTEPDGQIFNSRKEIIRVIKKTGAVSVLVPPDSKFKKYERVVIVTDFREDDFEKYDDVFSFLNFFNPAVYAVGSSKDNFAIMKENSGEWLKKVMKLLPRSEINTRVMEEESMDQLNGYIETIGPDLVISLKKKPNLIEKLLGREFDRKLMERVSRPLMVHGR